MEQNSQIVQHLYSQAFFKRRPDASHKSRANNFAKYNISAKSGNLNVFNNFFIAVNEAFPDYAITIDNILAKEDRVMVRYSISGIQRNNFMGMAPTNKKTTITSIDIFRLDHGKVAEHWDAAHQISALPKLSRQLKSPLPSRHSGSITTATSNKPSRKPFRRSAVTTPPSWPSTLLLAEIRSQ